MRYLIDILMIIGAGTLIYSIGLIIFSAIDAVNADLDKERAKHRCVILRCPECNNAPQVETRPDGIRFKCCGYETPFYNKYINAAADWNSYVEESRENG